MEELKDLRDIQGLDQISNWPLAIGWWIIITLLSVALICGLLALYHRYRYRKSWQFKSYQQLQFLESQLSVESHKQILQNLSIELKNIAMQTKNRAACAGLAGQQWLQWLKEHDPLGFDWLSQGILLIQYQYMPGETNYETNEMTKLINAAKAWVVKC